MSIKATMVRFADRVFRPLVLLIFLTFINLLNYFDRGAMGAVLSDVKEVYSISETQAGAIASAFMLGYMVFAPIFAQLSFKILPTRIMFFGLMVWCGAAFLTASAPDFYLFIIGRSIVGVGEAGFCGLAPTIIDNVAPVKQRTTWLSIFFAAIPCGYALGYVGGGVFSSYSNWRLVFVMESFLMLPFAIMCVFIPKNRSERKKKTASVEHTTSESAPLVADSNRAGAVAKPQSADEEENHSVKEKRFEDYTLWTALKTLFTNPVFMYNSFGYAALTGCLGAYAFWLPYFIHTYYGLDVAQASIYLGSVALVTGLGGTGLGGYILDRMGGSFGMIGTSRSLRLCWIFCTLGFPFAVLAFLIDNLVIFIIFLLIAEFFLFGTTSPINASALSCVPEALRSHAIAVQIFFIHLLGDFPSPVVTGVIADKTDLFFALLVLSLLLVVSTILFLIAWVYAKKALSQMKAAGIVESPGQEITISHKPIGQSATESYHSSDPVNDQL
eukprot:ANDGO_07587.mRNA.1 putative sphingolipid transporter spinster homolog 3